MTCQTRFAYTRPSRLKPSDRLAARADTKRTGATAPSDVVGNVLADVAAGSATLDFDEGRVGALRHGEGFEGLAGLSCFVGVWKS
jgi:hypothetical protein